MLTLDLSSTVSEIPNDAYATLSQNPTGWFNTQSRVQPADWLSLENNEKTTKLSFLVLVRMMFINAATDMKLDSLSY